MVCFVRLTLTILTFLIAVQGTEVLLTPYPLCISRGGNTISAPYTYLILKNPVIDSQNIGNYRKMVSNKNYVLFIYFLPPQILLLLFLKSMHISIRSVITI